MTHSARVACTSTLPLHSENALPRWMTTLLRRKFSPAPGKRLSHHPLLQRLLARRTRSRLFHSPPLHATESLREAKAWTKCHSLTSQCPLRNPDPPRSPQNPRARGAGKGQRLPQGSRNAAVEDSILLRMTSHSNLLEGGGGVVIR